ncbi:MAG: hypothetical protein BMS9Abin20_0973 [Acidimicrobiia bacterium]|nr:MAG: hypothetical protein BMS9Abin20_0973 [Acidimicrobiia bacterium]
MDPSVQWNWVLLAYGFAYIGLVAFAASIAMRITRARRRLGEHT